MTEHVLVTGGCGFIGSNIVHKLVAEGYKVTIIDDLSAGKKANIDSCLLEKKCQFIKGNIANISSLEKIIPKVDTIIHEAANPDVRASKDNLMRDFEINVIGTLNILQTMVKYSITKLIFASSCGTVYGDAEVVPTPENTPLAPISHYGASKAASEQYISSFSSLYNIEAITLRLGNIYGPPSTHGVIYDFYKKLTKDPTTLQILGDGKQTKSYLYVDDCVEAHLLALKTKLKGHVPLNIASAEGITVNEIAQQVVKAMDLKQVTFSYSGGNKGWAGDVSRAIAETRKASKILSWKPKVSLPEGIQKYINWLKRVNK